MIQGPMGFEEIGEEEDFAAMLEESFTQGSPSEGTVVKGTIVAIEKDLAVIDVGLKVEGRVALKEFGTQARDGEPRHLHLEAHPATPGRAKRRGRPVSGSMPTGTAAVTSPPSSPRRCRSWRTRRKKRAWPWPSASRASMAT